MKKFVCLLIAAILILPAFSHTCETKAAAAAKESVPSKYDGDAFAFLLKMSPILTMKIFPLPQVMITVQRKKNLCPAPAALPPRCMFGQEERGDHKRHCEQRREKLKPRSRQNLPVKRLGEADCKRNL